MTEAYSWASIAGRYRIDFSGRQYVWTQRDGEFADIVIETDAAQISDYDHNAYGLACRLDPGIGDVVISF